MGDGEAGAEEEASSSSSIAAAALFCCHCSSLPQTPPNTLLLSHSMVTVFTFLTRRGDEGILCVLYLVLHGFCLGN
jgi:hypothetical protein